MKQWYLIVSLNFEVILLIECVKEAWVLTRCNLMMVLWAASCFGFLFRLFKVALKPTFIDHQFTFAHLLT